MDLSVSQTSERRRESQDSYDVFMSYSHSADELLAPVLQRLIRRVGQPWYRRSTLRVFRDQSNLPMSASLWGSIEAALERSTYFVLMASSTAADSPWVAREVEYWRRNRERKNFFIVLTSGRIEWDTHRCDFDWDGPSALPAVMSGWFLEEPCWIDLRLPAKDGVHPNQRNDRLRDAARTIAASLYGIDKDQLDGEDERESRRARRTLRGGIVALSVLLVLALAGAGVAIVQLRMALELQRLATARQLVAQADAARGADPRTALLLGIAAQHIHPDEQTASTPSPPVDSPAPSRATRVGAVRWRSPPGAGFSQPVWAIGGGWRSGTSRTPDPPAASDRF